MNYSRAWWCMLVSIVCMPVVPGPARLRLESLPT